MNRLPNPEPEHRLIKSIIEENYSYLLTDSHALISILSRQLIELCVGNRDRTLYPESRQAISEQIFETIWNSYSHKYPTLIFSDKEQAFFFFKTLFVILRRTHERGMGNELPPFGMFDILTVPIMFKIFMDFATGHGLTEESAGFNYPGVLIIN